MFSAPIGGAHLSLGSTFIELSAGAFTASAFKLHLFRFSSMVPQRILKHPNNNDIR